MYRTHEGEFFLAAESYVSAAQQGKAREPAAAHGNPAAPAVPSARG